MGRYLRAVVAALLLVGVAGTAPASADPADLQITPANYDYGEVTVDGSHGNKTFTVTNVGSAPLTVSSVFRDDGGANEFQIFDDFCTGVTLAPAQSCDILLFLLPSSEGPKDGTLVATSDDAGATVTALVHGVGVAPAPGFSLSPSGSFDFGTIQILQPGIFGSQAFTVTNTGNTNLFGWSNGVSGGGADFPGLNIDTCSGHTIVPGGTCTVSVLFQPQSVGPKSATLTVSNPDAGQRQVALSGAGSLNPPTIEVSPSSHDFGVVRLGMNATQTFTVTNTGGSSFRIFLTESLGQFALFNDSCRGVMLAPAATCSLSIVFAPDQVGPDSGNVRVVTAAGTANIPLTAAGRLPVSAITASPSSVDLGTVAVGEQSATQRIVLSNAGETFSFVYGATIAGADSAEFAFASDCGFGAPWAQAYQCSVDVSFTPIVAGVQTATLEIQTDLPGDPVIEVTLSGSGTQPAAFISPTSNVFGQVEVGSSSQTTFHIQNRGTADLLVSSSAIVGLDPAAFVIAGDTCTSVLIGIGSTCQIDVRFAPTTAAFQSAYLEVTSNAPSSPNRMTIAGTGLSANSASGDPGPGGTVQTGGGVATPADPTTTAVTTPQGGAVTINEAPGGTPPTGYGFVGQQVSITAPPGNASEPIRITFRLDASAIPAGYDASTLEVFRNGVLVQECDVPGSGQAIPTPCVDARTTLADGDIEITAVTVQASLWNLAFANPYNFAGFFAPVDNAPIVNKANAGQSIPIKFGLGSYRGMDIFAAGSPYSQRTTCSSGAPIDVIETVATPGESPLSYASGSNWYQFVWKTQKAWAGTCRSLSLHFADGSTHTALFSFVK